MSASDLNLLFKYFPHLSDLQREQFAALGPLYTDWNSRINVISRKDLPELYLRHILHSLAIAKMQNFAPNSRILDIGTGGGFPAVPLAILFPDVYFTAVDSIGKKIRVVQEVAKAIDLKNLTALNSRAESIPGTFDFIVSRAVAPASCLLEWGLPLLEKSPQSQPSKGSLPNGFLLLKGGDLASELAATGRPTTTYNISDWFSEDFFATKKLVHIAK